MSSILGGIAVVFDDKAAKPGSGDHVHELIDALRGDNVPVVIFPDRPDESVVQNLGDSCFFILDWQFEDEVYQNPLEGLGITLGDELQKSEIAKNIEFIKVLRGYCFSPVFVFSNEDPQVIASALASAGIQTDGDNAELVYIISKSGGVANDVISKIKALREGNPALHVFEKWQRATSKSRSALLWDLYSHVPSWPSVLWSNFARDNVDPANSILDLLHRNLRARIPSLQIDESMLNTSVSPNTDQLRALFEWSTFIPESGLVKGEWGSGDLFNKGGNNRVWINIRADCDTVVRGDRTRENTRLYLLKGKLVSESDLTSKFFDDRYGLRHGGDSNHVVFPVSGGRAYQFSFSEIEQVPISDLEQTGQGSWVRVGKVTSPTITQIRQRFAHWIQREGYHKIPAECIGDAAGASQAVVAPPAS